MKRFRILLALSFFIIMLSYQSFAAEYGSHSTGEAKSLINSFDAAYAGTYGTLQEKIEINGDVYWADDDIARDYGIIAYGGPSAVTSSMTSNKGISEQSSSGSEWRYLGLSPWFEPITNWKFPDDQPATVSMWLQPWIQYPWELYTPQKYDNYQYASDANSWLKQAIGEENNARYNNGEEWGYSESIFSGSSNLNEYFTIISPRTEYTAFSSVGWLTYQKNGSWVTLYNTFSLPPLPKKTLDLKVEITDNKFEASTGKYTATVKATLVRDDGGVLKTNTNPILVDFRAKVKDPTTGNWVSQVQGWNPEAKSTDDLKFTKTTVGDTQEFKFTYTGLANQLLKLQAYINPPSPGNTGAPGYEPTASNATDAGRAVTESDYSNNVAEKVFPDNLPDLALILDSTGYNGSPGSFQAQLHAEVVKDTNLIYPYPKPVHIWYRYVRNGNLQPWVKTTLTEHVAGAKQVLAPLPWDMSAGDTIKIEGFINPVIDGSGNPIIPQTIGAIGIRAVDEDENANGNNYIDWDATTNPPNPSAKYLKIGVYPATEKLIEIKDTVEVKAYWMPTGRTGFDDYSWEPNSTIGEPTLKLKSDRLTPISGGDYFLTSNETPVDGSVFGTDKDQETGLSCQTDSRNKESFGTNPSHKLETNSNPSYGPNPNENSDEGGCTDIGTGFH